MRLAVLTVQYTKNTVLLVTAIFWDVMPFSFVHIYQITWHNIQKDYHVNKIWSSKCQGTRCDRKPYSCRCEKYISNELYDGVMIVQLVWCLGCGLEDLEFKSRQMQEIFLVKTSRLTVEAHPASYSVDTRGCFPGGKQLGYEVDHSPASISEVKNGWSYTSTSYVCIHRDTFALIIVRCSTGHCLCNSTSSHTFTDQASVVCHICPGCLQFSSTCS